MKSFINIFWKLYDFPPLIKSQNRIKAMKTPKMTTCTSTFIATTTKSFWTHVEHMHISQRTADGFKLEGIDDPEDLFDFSTDDLYSLFGSMKNPVRYVGDIGNYTAAHPMHISAKSNQRIIVTDNAMRYYTQVRRSITMTDFIYLESKCV